MEARGCGAGPEVTDAVTGGNAAVRAPDGRARAALWTPARVEERLAEAVRVLARLPTPGLSQLGMEVVRTAAEAYGREEARVVPCAADISRAEEALGWTEGLPLPVRRLLLSRAARVKWRKLAREYDRSERSLLSYYKLALLHIAGRLNGAKSGCVSLLKNLR